VAAIVVPFQSDGKSRLGLPPEARRTLALAMLGDVLAACGVVGPTRVVTASEDGAELARELGATPVEDPGDGQGEAVRAALEGLGVEPVLVVNADVPSVVPHDLRSLLAATPAGGLALVAALDGTTNALSLPAPQVYAPLYGPGSAERFLERARELGLEGVAVAIPSLVDDVDTIRDLRRLELRAGPRTQIALGELEIGVQL
jgi:2-phospho-L-lactate guanylyltransferase